MTERYDAVVVGAGPNGLAAAARLVRAGWSVHVVEGGDTVGGGSRSAELTLPGVVHDVCSAIHPYGIGSPFFRDLPLAEHGLEWVHPDAPLAHPLDRRPAVVLERSLADTAAGLSADGDAWRDLVEPFARNWDALTDHLFGPPVRVPRHPFLLARFGLAGLWSARRLAATRFRGRGMRAAFAGLAAHAVLPLGHVLTAGIGLLFGASLHAGGWPMARGGSQSIADALAGIVTAGGGTIETGRFVRSVDDLPRARAVLFDTTPRVMLGVLGAHAPSALRRRFGRFEHGPGVFKIDYALSEPVPWADPAVGRAGTVHVGGTFEEVAAAEDAVAQGRHPERPFLLVAQQSPFDPTRAPEGTHTLWAYCHVPNGSTVDMTGRIDAQIERFAPGFRDTVLARHTLTPADLEAYNPNYVGGDIIGGSNAGLQALLRPRPALNPYATGMPGVYLCSASTPPGGGVHGMCGYHAANAALSDAAAGRLRPT